MKSLKTLAAAAVAALALSACGSSDAGNDGGEITIGASPVPHTEILRYVKDNLAKKAGIEIEIKTYEGYTLPNSDLAAGDIDANYFQHLPYYEEEVKSKKYEFQHGNGIHIEPYGIYSKKIKNLKNLPDGAKVAITNDPSNQTRALELLAKNKIITLPKGETATIYNIKENPKNLAFKEADAPAIPKLLPDVDIAIINGNYALQNGLTPSKDALYLEDGKDNPYANILAWKSDAKGKKLESIKKLDELLHSPEVAAYIKEKWPNGEVIPAF